MENKYIFVPVLIQVAFTLWLYIYLAIVKSQTVKSGKVNENRRALYDDAWPENVLQINNCIRNQFEAPILFYVIVGVLWGIGGVTIYVHVAVWLFVTSRIAHAVIHTGSNYVPVRRKIFMIGCFILMGLLILSVYQLVSI